MSIGLRKFFGPALLLASILHSSTGQSGPSSRSLVPAILSQEEVNPVLERAAENYINGDPKRKNYVYMLREEERKLDRKGNVQSVESRTSEVMILRHHTIERLLAKNDRPLSERESAREEQKIQNAILQDDAHSQVFRCGSISKSTNRPWQEIVITCCEVIAGFNYKFVGIEDLNGREAYAIDGKPRPQYQVPLQRHKATPLLQLSALDRQNRLAVGEVDAHFTSFFPFGLFPVRLHEGTRFLLENTRVNDEIWLPNEVLFRVYARVGLLQNFDEELEMNCREYRKFPRRYDGHSFWHCTQVAGARNCSAATTPAMMYANTPTGTARRANPR